MSVRTHMLALQVLLRARELGVDAARFMVSGCIDAPDEMDAGSWLSFDYRSYIGDEDGWGIGPRTFRRDESVGNSR